MNLPAKIQILKALQGEDRVLHSPALAQGLRECGLPRVGPGLSQDKGGSDCLILGRGCQPQDLFPVVRDQL